jgi:flagellin-like protein
MPNKSIKRLSRSQRGITGLETAIILTAFVVVASVFAYSVLSAGLFSSEKGKEAVHAGLQQARSSMEVVGNVKATSIANTELADLDTVGNWTESANVTGAQDTSDFKEGTGSVDWTIDAGFGTGLIAYNDLASTVDLTSPQHYSLQMWIKSDTSLAAGVIELILDESTGCGSADETIDVPALTANTWRQVTLSMAAPTILNTVACVALNANSDPAAIVLTVDLIEAPREVTSVNFVVANALDGEAINLTTTTDSDSDGLISDETALHVMSIIYSDTDQRTSDIAWTKTERGKGDGDDLLESGEKMQITVSTIAADPMPVGSSQFTLSLVREQGSDLIISRTLPAVMTTEMDLN